MNYLTVSLKTYWRHKFFLCCGIFQDDRMSNVGLQNVTVDQVNFHVGN